MCVYADSYLEREEQHKKGSILYESGPGGEF